MQKEEAVVLITASFITPTSNNPTFQSNTDVPWFLDCSLFLQAIYRLDNRHQCIF